MAWTRAPSLLPLLLFPVIAAASLAVLSEAHLMAQEQPVAALDVEVIPDPSDDDGGPTRDDIMSCAADWCRRKIPYCQCNGPVECCGDCPYCGTYRCDCSGYVSYCFNLTYGYDTRTLPNVTTPIEKDELENGDILLCEGVHVVFFAGWTSPNKTHYVAYQEPGCHCAGPHHAFKSVVNYPFNFNPTCFKPRRLNSLAAHDDDDGSALAGGTMKTSSSSPSSSRRRRRHASMATMPDLTEAFANPPSYPAEQSDEARIADRSVKEHAAALGYFTYQ